MNDNVVQFPRNGKVFRASTSPSVTPEQIIECYHLSDEMLNGGSDEAVFQATCDLVKSQHGVEINNGDIAEALFTVKGTNG